MKCFFVFLHKNCSSGLTHICVFNIVQLKKHSPKCTGDFAKCRSKESETDVDPDIPRSSSPTRSPGGLGNSLQTRRVCPLLSQAFGGIVYAVSPQAPDYPFCFAGVNTIPSKVQSSLEKLQRGKVKSQFFPPLKFYVLKCEIHCQKSNTFTGPPATEHPRNSPGAGNGERPASRLPHLPWKSTHLFSSSETRPPLGERVTLATFSFRLGDHENSKHTTCWQSTWKWAPGSPCQVASSDFTKITLSPEPRM